MYMYTQLCVCVYTHTICVHTYIHVYAYNIHRLTIKSRSCAPKLCYVALRSQISMAKCVMCMYLCLV
jgi:hypothetical protein